MPRMKSGEVSQAEQLKAAVIAKCQQVVQAGEGDVSSQMLTSGGHGGNNARTLDLVGYRIDDDTYVTIKGQLNPAGRNLLTRKSRPRTIKPTSVIISNAPPVSDQRGSENFDSMRGNFAVVVLDDTVDDANTRILAGKDEMIKLTDQATGESATNFRLNGIKFGEHDIAVNDPSFAEAFVGILDRIPADNK